MKIAVAMAKSRVGRVILNILDEREFPVQEVVALDSKESVGQKISFGKSKILQVQSLSEYDFAGTDIAFFAADENISAEYGSVAKQSDSIVIGNSSYFASQKNVPLIIPEVNAHLAASHNNVIASPSALTTQILVSLKFLHDIAMLKRIVVSAYQATSDMDSAGMDELHQQTKSMYSPQILPEKMFHRRIAFNCIPQVGDFNEDGYTEAERRLCDEVHCILGSEIKVSATCVYVPVFVGHAVSVNAEFCNAITEKDVFYALSKAPGVLVADRREDGGYVTPIDCAAEESIYVSRIRNDPELKNCINMWIVADNIHKGAALNMVQIAELLI